MQKVQVLLGLGFRLLLANPALFSLTLLLVFGSRNSFDFLKGQPFTIYATVIIISFVVFAYLEGAVISGFLVTLRSSRLSFNEILQGGKTYFRHFLILKVLQGIIGFIIMLPLFFMMFMYFGIADDGLGVDSPAFEEASALMEWGPAIVVAIGSVALWPINIVAPILIVVANKHPIDAITSSYSYIQKNLSELLPLLSVIVLVPSLLLMNYTGNPLKEVQSMLPSLVMMLSTLIGLPTMIVWISKDRSEQEGIHNEVRELKNEE